MMKLKIKYNFIAVAILLIAGAGFLAYINSLGGEFLYDDMLLVVKNIKITSWNNIFHLFRENIYNILGENNSFYYRPILMVTYMMDHSLWNLNPVGYHFTNILLHILSAITLFFLLCILFKDKLLSFLASIFFVTCPIHTEAVSYISGRADPLSALFIFAAFISYLLSLDSDNVRAYIIMSVCYICALLSKESSLIFPALIFLYHYIFKGKINRKGVALVMAIFFTYLFLRIVFRGPSLVSDTVNVAPFLDRVPTFFTAIAAYIRLLFVPYPLHMGYGYRQFYWHNPSVITGVIIVLLSALYVYKNRGKSGDLVSFSILWFFVTLLPQSNLFPINAYMSEHWLYLPSIGFFLILGDCVLVLMKKVRTAAIIYTVTILLFSSYVTARQNEYWRNCIAFYERTIKYSPHCGRSYNNLGAVYLTRRDPEMAIKILKKAVMIDPSCSDSYINLGIAYTELKKYDLAAQLFKQGLRINPRNAAGYYYLGRLYVVCGSEKQALEEFKKTVGLCPDYAEAHISLGSIYFNRKEYFLAKKHVDKALQLGCKIEGSEFFKILDEKNEQN